MKNNLDGFLLHNKPFKLDSKYLIPQKMAIFEKINDYIYNEYGNSQKIKGIKMLKFKKLLRDNKFIYKTYKKLKRSVKR